MLGRVGFRDLAFRQLPLALLAATAAAGATAGAGWSERLGPLPWIVSLVFVGLPHGAADFAVSRMAWGGRQLAAAWLAYAAAMAAVAAAFVLAPTATVLAFAAASCWHFGTAHAAADEPTGGPVPQGIAALARGCIVLAVPLAVWPAATATAAADLAALAVGPAAAADRFQPAAVRACGLALAAVCLAAVAVEGLLRARNPGGRGGWRRLLVELLAIASLGVFTDPLFSVGTYFLAWHAWRQMEPLAGSLGDPPPASCRDLGAAVVRIHAAALPLLLPAWGAIAAVWWWRAPAHAPRDLALASIAAYLVVTPAHDMLVRRLPPPASAHPTSPT